MHFNHDGQDAVRLGVDLANDPPATVAILIERCEEAGLIFDRPPGPSDHQHVIAFLTRWSTAVRDPQTAARVDALNTLLAEYAAAPSLTDHAGTGWHLHFRAHDLAPGRQIAALITVGTALHLAGRGIDRVGECAATGCRRLYADTSRNGRQQYCSPACANRMAVQRHRDRRHHAAAY